VKQLLRSLWWQEQNERVEATENLGWTNGDRLKNLTHIEEAILDFLVEFFRDHAEAPHLQTVKDHFTEENEYEPVTFLDEAIDEPFYSKGSYEKRYEDEVEKQAAEKFVETCKVAARIATRGEEIGQEMVKGTNAAVAYIFTTVEGKPEDNAGLLPHNMDKGEQALQDLYQGRKDNPERSYGILTGYGLFDAATAGIRKKHLYLHAGFQGHLKSTHMLNMALHACTQGGWNPLIFSSEMPSEDIQLLLVAIHSGDAKFNGRFPPLPAFQLLLGQMNEEQEGVFKVVKQDLITNPNHGTLRVIDSGEFSTFGSIMQRTIKEDGQCEVDMLWIDYLTRLPVDTKYRRMSLTEGRNETIADAKRFAMQFNGGKGLAVCSPFQINREGFKRGSTSGGKLDLTALAQYNAAEKEADTITYIWYGEEEEATLEPKIGLMKTRWGAKVNEPAIAYIDPDCRRIYDMSAGLTVSQHAPTAGRDVEEEIVL